MKKSLLVLILVLFAQSSLFSYVTGFTKVGKMVKTKGKGKKGNLCMSISYNKF